MHPSSAFGQESKAQTGCPLISMMIAGALSWRGAAVELREFVQLGAELDSRSGRLVDDPLDGAPQRAPRPGTFHESLALTVMSMRFHTLRGEEIAEPVKVFLGKT